MHLKKIKIVGFKSFASRAVLDFDAPVIAIVGPNGCGKSNIVDAFRWVLGEQSAKALRASKMEDLLFAGSASRGVSPYAEVSVTFANPKGILAMDAQEVTITRRLDRKGDSSYWINGEQRRLRDVQELLLGSGVGKNAFSLFEQGKLDQIIHMNPLQRRVMIDDAAGTIRFLQKKTEAVKRLEKVDDNLTRVHDIHHEVQSETKQLKRQAEQARVFQENQHNLELAEKALLLTRWTAAGREAAHQEIEEVRTKARAVGSHLSEVEEKLGAQKALVEQRQQRFSVLAEELLQHQKTYSKKQGECDSLRHRLDECQRRGQSLSDEKTSLLEQEAMFKKERDDLLAKQGQSRRKVTAQEKLVKDLAASVNAKEESLKADRRSEAQNVNEQISLVREEKSQTAILKQHEARFESARLQNQALLERLESLKKEHQVLQTTILQKQKLGSEKEEKVELLAGEKAKSAKALDTLLKSQQELAIRKKELSAKLVQLQAREETLNQLEKEMIGFSSGSKRLLEESQTSSSAIFGLLVPLFDLLNVQKGAEKWVARALHLYESSLVCETKESVLKVCDFANEHGIEDFSILCLETLQISKKSGALIDLVEKSPLAFSLLGGVELTESLELDRSGVVRNSGYFIDQKGVVFQRGLQKERSSGLARKHEKMETKASIDELELALAWIEEQESLLKANYEELQSIHNALVEQHQAQERELFELTVGLKKDRESLLKTSKQIALEESNSLKLQEQMETSSLKLHESQQTLDQLRLQETQLAKKIHSCKGTTQKKEAEITSSRRELKEQSRLLETYREEARGVQESVRILETRIEGAFAQQEKCEKDKAVNEKQAHESAALLVTLEKEAHLLGEKLKEVRAISSAEQNEQASTKKLAKQLEKEAEQLRKELVKQEKILHRLEVELTEESSKRGAIVEELHSRFHLSIEELQAIKLPPFAKVADAEYEVRKLQAALEKAGKINMTSIDQYAEKKERLDFLDDQMKDLKESRRKLDQLIKELEKEARKRFNETFKLVAANFEKHFSILFNGGEANLKLTGSKDPLEAGIEIQAKPPGKNLKAITLLSGGEKCLTALALLFALFEVRPAPFCILDEVDAPLDESNIGRFTDLLHQFTDQTQFLLVTHNKKTMAIADILTGVSMEEKGVSKLLSLSFKEREPALV